MHKLLQFLQFIQRFFYAIISKINRKQDVMIYVNKEFVHLPEEIVFDIFRYMPRRSVEAFTKHPLLREAALKSLYGNIVVVLNNPGVTCLNMSPLESPYTCCSFNPYIISEFEFTVILNSKTLHKYFSYITIRGAAQAVKHLLIKVHPRLVFASRISIDLNAVPSKDIDNVRFLKYLNNISSLDVSTTNFFLRCYNTYVSKTDGYKKHYRRTMAIMNTTRESSTRFSQKLVDLKDLPISLEHLKLCFDWAYDNSSTLDFKYFHRLQNVTELNLSKAIINHLLRFFDNQGMPHLRKLTLSNMFHTYDIPSASEIIRFPPSLTHLTLNTNPFLAGFCFDGLTIDSPELKMLKIENSAITTLDKLELPEGLKELYILKNPIKKISSLSLPRSLKKFALEDTLINDTLSSLTLPRTLESISFSSIQRKANVDGLMLPSSITRFELSLPCAVSTISSISGLRQLDTFICSNSKIRFSNLEFDTKILKNLDLSGSELIDFYSVHENNYYDEISRYILSKAGNLRTLDLSFLGLRIHHHEVENSLSQDVGNFVKSTFLYMFFPKGQPQFSSSLKEVNLSGNKFDTLSLNLPSQIEVLNLSHNNIEYFDFGNLPINLKKLKLNGNSARWHYGCLPSGLEWLDLAGNLLDQKDEENPKSKSRSTEFSHLTPQGISDMEFPNNLSYLSLKDNKITSIRALKLPLNLLELNLSDNAIQNCPAAVLPISLKKLTISYTQQLMIGTDNIPPFCVIDYDECKCGKNGVFNYK